MVRHAADDGEGRVEDGQRQDQDGDDGREQRRALRRLIAYQRYACQQIPQQHAARVTHEDLRRVEIPDQEAHRRACQAQDEHAGDFPVGHKSRIGDREAGDAGDARSQAVQAVDQVDGVRDAHDPDDGDQEGDHLREGDVPGAPGQHVRHAADLDRKEVQDRGAGDLPGQLDPRPQPLNVVDDAQQQDEGGSHQQSEHLIVPIAQAEETHQDAQIDRDAAEAGDRALVHAPVVLGHVHRADHRSDLDGEGRHDRGHDQGQEKRNEIFTHAHLP